MMRVTASIMISAPPDEVFELYADHQAWPDVFPAIGDVRLLRQEGSRQILEVAHREGTVINELVVRPPDEIDVYEVKRRYNAQFVNRFEPVAGGSLLAVDGTIDLKGWARPLTPFFRRHARRLMEQLQLQPIKAAAEAARARLQD